MHLMEAAVGEEERTTDADKKRGFPVIDDDDDDDDDVDDVDGNSRRGGAND